MAPARTSTLPRCSLLGIPVELRLQIYAHYFDGVALVSDATVEDLTIRFSTGHRTKNDKRDHEARSRVLSIRRVCKIIANETQEWVAHITIMNLSFQGHPDTQNVEPLSPFLCFRGFKNFALTIDVSGPDVPRHIKALRYMLTRLCDARRTGRKFGSVTLRATGWSDMGKKLLSILMRIEQLLQGICPGVKLTENMKERMQVYGLIQ